VTVEYSDTAGNGHHSVGAAERGEHGAPHIGEHGGRVERQVAGKEGEQFRDVVDVACLAVPGPAGLPEFGFQARRRREGDRGGDLIRDDARRGLAGRGRKITT
jgi:hypothetical protein